MYGGISEQHAAVKHNRVWVKYATHTLVFWTCTCFEPAGVLNRTCLELHVYRPVARQAAGCCSVVGLGDGVERGVVVRFFRDLANEFAVDDCAGAVNYDDRASGKTGEGRVGDADTVGLKKLGMAER